MWTMSTRKPRGRYHHGNLRRALIDEAVRTMQKSGFNGVTLRGAGAALGVSRTALYRHFADKDALLGAVAREGFVGLKAAMDAARARNFILKPPWTPPPMLHSSSTCSAWKAPPAPIYPASRS